MFYDEGEILASGEFSHLFRGNDKNTSRCYIFIKNISLTITLNYNKIFKKSHLKLWKIQKKIQLKFSYSSQKAKCSEKQDKRKEKRKISILISLMKNLNNLFFYLKYQKHDSTQIFWWLIKSKILYLEKQIAKLY